MESAPADVPSSPPAQTIALPPPAIAAKPLLLRRSLSWTSLLCLVYVTVCSGPFGLEELVTSVGPGMTFILLLITPIFWGIPLLFMSAELSSTTGTRTFSIVRAWNNLTIII